MENLKDKEERMGKQKTGRKHTLDLKKALILVMAKQRLNHEFN